MPLLNILASRAHVHTAFLDIINATAHLEVGGKKYARYIIVKLVLICFVANSAKTLKKGTITVELI
jgi:hypothetical protein